MSAIKDLMPVKYSDEVILTTEQLAEFYECNSDQIRRNFSNNKDKFIEGKHYFKVEGAELENLRKNNLPMQISSMTRTFYLWTKQGAARHAKMLTTEKAWVIFETLEENYFNPKKVESITREPLTFGGILRDVDETKTLIQKIYAVKDGIATAQATNMVGKFYGYDLSELNRLIPPADHETGYMNATQLGEKIGKTARATNKWLSDNGYQYKDGRDWRLTAKGKQYAEEIPYNTGKHSGYQIRWNLALLNDIN